MNVGGTMIGWRRVLVYTHRWLGIAGGVLFIAWFVSGIVLMYVGMPSLSADERLATAPILNLSTVALTPAEAAARAGAAPDQMRVGMLNGRPVYRLSRRGRLTTVYADSGEVLSGLSVGDVLPIAREFAPQHTKTLEFDQELADADQWTIPFDAHRPLHRVAFRDAADTHLYVSDRTGEPVMRTTAPGRRWAYAGAVLHWLYFTPLRQHTQLWIQSVIWLAIIGCVLTLSGLIWGLWRLSPSRRYRLRAEPHSVTPYSGFMKWHHYAGLVFGVTTFTWVLSGCLSLDPFSWHLGTEPTAAQRAAMLGVPYTLDSVTVEGLRDAEAAIAVAFLPRELELVQFKGQMFARARHPETGEQRVVSAVSAGQGAFAHFDHEEVADAARLAMPAASIVEASWLEEYDAYYYDRDGGMPLPILRVRYDDPQETWLYFDPSRGTIARKEERLTRLNRWLYHGLHSLDFPFLYYRRPVWDVVVIGLSLGGIALSATTLMPAWRRLRRHARRWATSLLLRVQVGDGE